VELLAVVVDVSINEEMTIMDQIEPMDESVNRRVDQVSAHGPKIKSDYSIIPQLHDIDPKQLGTSELLQTMGQQISLLAQKEVELMRTEMKTDIAKEMDMAKLMAGAGITALLGVTMLLVSLAMAISPVLASLVIGILLLVAAGIMGWIGWSKRVEKPLDTTRQTLQEDVKWAKHRFT
jgi:uncharacterized membrane protein YqjE